MNNCYKEFKVYRSSYHCMVRRAKLNYYSSLISESCGDQRKVYGCLKSLIHSDKPDILQAQGLNADDTIVQKLESYNSFFINKITNIYNHSSVSSHLVDTTCSLYKSSHCFNSWKIVSSKDDS